MQKLQPEKGNAPEVAATEALSEANPYQKESNMVDSKAVEVSSQPVFSFGEHSVRVVVRDGEPWFVASDLCKALEIANSRDALLKLTDDEKGVGSTDTPGGKQEVSLVSESGMYTLVLRCRDAVKEGTVPFAFRKWVTSEVLPAIRKTGVYVGKPFAVNRGDVLTQDEQNTLRLMLKSAVEKLPKEKQAGAMVKGWSKLKAHFGVTYREIPRQEFSEAVSIIARHTAEFAEWELVDDAPPAGTVNELVAEWVKKIEAPNGYPATIFEPIVEAVQRKTGKQPAQPDTSRMQAAFDAAAQAAAAVQKTVFNTVLSGNDEWKYGRWMLAFVDDSTKGSPAYARQMEQGAFVTTWPRLVKDVANGEAMCTSEELLQLASACIGRLEKRTAPAKLMG